MSETQSDNSIPGQLRTVNQQRDRVAQRQLSTVAGILGTKTVDYGPVSAVLDIVAATTGFNKADIPAGEAFTCYRLMSKILRYMNLRALGGPPRHEPIEDTLGDMLGEAARLFAEYQTNEGRPMPQAPTAPEQAADRDGQPNPVSEPDMRAILELIQHQAATATGRAGPRKQS